MIEIIIFAGFSDVLIEVILALTPLLGVFIIFQIFFVRMERSKLYQTLVGILFTVLGLALFLQGVHIGFLPMGEEIGLTIGALSYNWILIPIGFVLGFVTTIAEPAVRVLNYEVEKVSSGSIKGKILLYTLSIGVGLFVAIAMLRILYGIPLMYILVPGYILAFILTKFSSKTFISIAFDSGGVATGPMTATFILAIAVGTASELEGRNPLIEGFGLVSLVALAPVLAVLVLGMVYQYHEQKANKQLKEEKQ